MLEILTSSQKQKAEIKERIRLSNLAVQNGSLPDPWVIAFRKKNNLIKAKWKALQPKHATTRVAKSTSFKKGLIPHNKKTAEELAISIARWKAGTKVWHQKNRDRINARLREKRKNDIQFRIKCNLRQRLSFLVRKSIASKTSQTMNLLGCDMPFFLSHLESLFQTEMNFNNYGKWHIDHIKPCNSFNLKDPSQQRECFHYTNLQPLWALENRIKSDKIFAPIAFVGALRY